MTTTPEMALAESLDCRVTCDIKYWPVFSKKNAIINAKNLSR
jgi:hypothetical protein